MDFDGYVAIIYLIGFAGMFFHAYKNMLVYPNGVTIDAVKKFTKFVFAGMCATVWPVFFAYWYLGRLHLSKM